MLLFVWLSATGWSLPLMMWMIKAFLELCVNFGISRSLYPSRVGSKEGPATNSAVDDITDLGDQPLRVECRCEAEACRKSSKHCCNACQTASWLKTCTNDWGRGVQGLVQTSNAARIHGSWSLSEQWHSSTTAEEPWRPRCLREGVSSLRDNTAWGRQDVCSWESRSWPWSSRSGILKRPIIYNNFFPRFDADSCQMLGITSNREPFLNFKTRSLAIHVICKLCSSSSRKWGVHAYTLKWHRSLDLRCKILEDGMPTVLVKEFLSSWDGL